MCIEYLKNLLTMLHRINPPLLPCLSLLLGEKESRDKCIDLKITQQPVTVDESRAIYQVFSSLF